MAASKRRSDTPIRAALVQNSALHPQVCDGMGAIKKRDRNHFADAVRTAFADSLELDKAVKSQHAEENRWDYLLGHKASGDVIGVEPHSAKTDEISTIIRKKDDAAQQLATHLKPGKRVSRWLWVSSGKTHFADTEKAVRRLDQSGIKYVGGEILPKHLPNGKS